MLTVIQQAFVSLLSSSGFLVCRCSFSPVTVIPPKVLPKPSSLCLRLLSNLKTDFSLLFVPINAFHKKAYMVYMQDEMRGEGNQFILNSDSIAHCLVEGSSKLY